MQYGMIALAILVTWFIRPLHNFDTYLLLTAAVTLGFYSSRSRDTVTTILLIGAGIFIYMYYYVEIPTSVAEVAFYMFMHEVTSFAFTTCLFTLIYRTFYRPAV